MAEAKSGNEAHSGSGGLRQVVAGLLSQKSYGEAVMALFQALDTLQQPPKALEDDLVFAMNEFTRQLLEGGKEQNATWLWLKCVELCREQSALVYYSYSRFLLSLEKIFEAIRIMERAVNIDPNFVLALEGIENMKGLVVDQWHFRMINDRERNEAYDLAIRQALQRVPNAIVLDIGGGTGLLSMYAARAGAAHVYCCEVSPNMAELARRCITQNGFSEKITVIEAHSTDLYITSEINGNDPSCGLPHRVSIIVTELVDSGLLGEHIIEVLKDASERLLVQSDGIVIPHGAEVFAVPVQSTELASRQYPIRTAAAGSWNDISYHQITHSTISPQKFPFPVLAIDEEYTCEAYRMLRANSRLVPLSETLRLGYLTFSPPSFALTHSTETKQIPCDCNFEFLLNRAGTVHAISTWFTLHLEPPTRPRAIVVNTAPDRIECGWDQAIIFLREMQSCCADETLRLTMTFASDHMSIAPGRKPQSNVVYSIGEMDMAHLNNHQLFECCMNDFFRILTSFRSRRENSLRIIELGNSWRSLLLTEYLAAIQSGTLDKYERIIHCPSEQHCQYFNHLLAYHCSTHSTGSTPSPSFPKIFSGSLFERSPLFQPSCENQLIICDLVEGCGLLKQNVFSDLSFVYHSITSTSSLPPLVFPHSLSIKVALLEHPTLWRHSRILEGNTISVDVATLTNRFGVTLIREVDLHGVPFPNPNVELSADSPRFLSSPHTAMTVKLLDVIQQIPGSDSSPLISSVSLTSDFNGILHGVAVWYSINLSDSGVSLDTGPLVRPGNDDPCDHYWRQIVFLSASPIELESGTPVSLEIVLDRISGVWCRHNHSKPL